MKAQYDVQDFGTIDLDNAIWLFCENMKAVAALRPGNTTYVDFKTGMGRDRVRVTRLNDKECSHE